MMSDNFRNLDLNRDDILEAIKEFFETKPELEASVSESLELKNEVSQQYRCNVSTNQGEFFLDIYYLKDGNTTLQRNQGKFLEKVGIMSVYSRKV